MLEKVLSLAQNQKGLVAPMALLLVVMVGLLAFLLVSSTLPFTNNIFQSLFPKQSSSAAGNIDLSLVPSNVAVAQNQTFLVDVVIDAKTERPTAVQLVLKYNPQDLEITKFEPGFYFNKSDAFGPPTIDNSTGTVYATLTQGPICPTGPTSCVFQYKSGAGTIATLEVKALRATNPTTSLTISTTNSETQIAALNLTGDQLGSVTNSSIDIAATPTVSKTAQFSLAPQTTTLPAGNEIGVQVKMSSATDSANLFAAKLSFDPNILEVSRIDTAGSFITQWINNNSFDNSVGKVSLIGAVPNPGYISPATPPTMATVFFRGKSAGTSTIRFDGSSAIYRNSDTANILLNTTPSNITVTGTITPSPSPTPSRTPTPTTAPTSTPIASATAAPTAIASATSAPTTTPTTTPTPSQNPSACVLTSASWVSSSNPITQSKVVGLSVTSTGNCVGRRVNFSVLEDDGTLGTDNTVNTPPATTFRSGNVATSSWIAEFQDDGLLGAGNPPEYFFRASLEGGNTINSSTPLLAVNKAGINQPLEGDLNGDGVIDLADLSLLYSNWNNETNVSDIIDLNDDGKINAFDAVILIQILRAIGVID